jgi:hypothetical protein
MRVRMEWMMGLMHGRKRPKRSWRAVINTA